MARSAPPCVISARRQRPYSSQTAPLTGTARVTTRHMAQRPEIRIGYGFQLESIFKKLFETGKKGDKETFPTAKEFWAKYGRLPQAWRTVEAKVVDAMQNTLELDFHQNVIDVHLAYTFHSLSNPMIVGVRYANDERFLGQMVNELTRRLLNDNTRRVPTSKIVKEMFPDATLSNATRSVILVHAVQELIFRDVLDMPEPLSRQMENAQKYPDYATSWDIVQQRGYKDLLEDFRQRCATTQATEAQEEVVVEAVA